MKPGIHSFYWRYVLRSHLGITLMVAFFVVGTALFEMATVGFGLPVLEAAIHSAGTTNRIVLMTRAVLTHFQFSAANHVVLLVLLGLVCITAILRSGFVLLMQYGTAGFAKRLPCEIRSNLLRHVLSAPYDYFLDKGRGTILYNLSQPPTSVFQVITYFSKLCHSLMTALAMLGLMLYLSWWATLSVAVLGFLWVQGWRRFSDHRSAKAGQAIYDLESQVNKVEVDAIDGVKVVKTHGLASELVGRQEKLLRFQIKPHLKIVLLGQGANFINEGMAAVIVMVLGGLSLGLQWGGMPFSSLVIFFVALRRISPSLGGISASYAELNRERRNIEVIAEILHQIPQEKFGSQKIEEVQTVRFRDVSFCYPAKKEQRVLQNVDLLLKKGELTALVGQTGSGKSTLANLLVGFYLPVQGEILVNGISLFGLDLESWRCQVGLVSQDIFLFNDTIKENIALWNPEISMDRVQQAVKQAQLHDFILSLPQGYETMVGDRGLKLSGGQCQRVAIARAILKKPEVLIFDEATSALDNITERAVYEAIHSLRKEAMVLVIAHRLSTIQSADQIVVLEKGKVVECGRHDNLLKQNKVYMQLYQGITV